MTADCPEQLLDLLIKTVSEKARPDDRAKLQDMLAKLGFVLHTPVNLKDDGLVIDAVVRLLLKLHPRIRDHFAR